jgi:hypothetical protein
MALFKKPSFGGDNDAAKKKLLEEKPWLKTPNLALIDEKFKGGLDRFRALMRDDPFQAMMLGIGVAEEHGSKDDVENLVHYYWDQLAAKDQEDFAAQVTHWMFVYMRELKRRGVNPDDAHW